MKVPGVAAVVGGITGGAVQMLQAGVQSVADTADTMQSLASPVVESVSHSTSRFLGIASSSNGRPERRTATVRWQSGRRVHLDLDPLLPFPRWHQHAAMVEEPVRNIAGVANAHVEGSLGRLVVELEDLGDNADDDRVLDEVRDVVSAVADDLAAAGTEPAIRTAPFADPGNPLAILVPLTAAAFDAVAIGAAVTGWVVRLPAAPRTTRAAAALLNNQPRMVAVLESRLGRVGTDLALAASTAAANGLTQAVGTPLLNLTQRILQISEADAHRRRWRDREPQLASPTRPQAPVVPIISSAGASSVVPRHNWAAAAAGEASHVVVDGAIDAAIDTEKGSMAGPVEDYVN
ncbi:MAG: cation-translocating P-type ATPase, partial [Mycobacterium sp.]